MRRSPSCSSSANWLSTRPFTAPLPRYSARAGSAATANLCTELTLRLVLRAIGRVAELPRVVRGGHVERVRGGVDGARWLMIEVSDSSPALARSSDTTNVIAVPSPVDDASASLHGVGVRLLARAVRSVDDVAHERKQLLVGRGGDDAAILGAQAIEGALDLGRRRRVRSSPSGQYETPASSRVMSLTTVCTPVPIRRALTREPDSRISRSTVGCARSAMSSTVIFVGSTVAGELAVVAVRARARVVPAVLPGRAGLGFERRVDERAVLGDEHLRRRALDLGLRHHVGLRRRPRVDDAKRVAGRHVEVVGVVLDEVWLVHAGHLDVGLRVVPRGGDRRLAPLRRRLRRPPTSTRSTAPPGSRLSSLCSIVCSASSRRCRPARCSLRAAGERATYRLGSTPARGGPAAPRRPGRP